MDRDLFKLWCLLGIAVALAVFSPLGAKRRAELAGQRSTEYENFDQAISSFIESEWSKGIDGVRVTRQA